MDHYRDYIKNIGCGNKCNNDLRAYSVVQNKA